MQGSSSSSLELSAMDKFHAYHFDFATQPKLNTEGQTCLLGVSLPMSLQ